MFLGPGGSGKSSLLDGLRNQPLRLAESTALADILNIKYHWVGASDADDAWREMGEEDEVQELASLCRLTVKDEIKKPQGAATNTSPPVHTTTVAFSDQDVQKVSLIQKDVTESVTKEAWQVQQKHKQLQQMQQLLQQWQQQLLQEEQQLLQEEQQLQHEEQQLQHIQHQDYLHQKQQQLLQKQQWLQQAQQHLQREQQQLQSKYAPHSTGQEVIMRIWDCGGQPIFLDVLSAFLTSRTMFLLLFDASQPLNNKCQGSWRHEGHTYHGKEYNITFLQLMMQWMRLIHASLVAKNEMSTALKEAAQNEATQGEALQSEATQGEATQSEATTDRMQSVSLPPYPRIMIVGTHGDRISSMEEQKVLKEMESSCSERAFQDLIIDRLIVNNTTAGGGREEDPGYRRIRKGIYDFTHSLTTPTPLAWVSFRKVVQKAAVDSPVLSYEQVLAIAEICGIAQSVVPSVLHFYHQLGVFLHYKKIESLSTTVIAEPQWLIKQLCKLLMPEWYCARPQNLANLWKWLEEKGILLQPLYENLWGDCGLRGGAQALVDLLEHFDLAMRIDTGSVPKEMRRYTGCKYFVPCMLNARIQPGPDRETEKMTGQLRGFVREAATLHITFNTRYIPPGFFVRLAVQMTKSEKCIPVFERSTFRDSITFRYGEVDRITITESKSLVSVHMDFIRIKKRTSSISRFADSCISFRSELETMCKEVLCWFPSIELDFAFRCNCSAGVEEHFSIISNRMNRDTIMPCSQDRVHQMHQEHKYWLPPAQLTLQPDIEDGKPTKTEMKNIAKELEKMRSSTRDLAGEMEVEYSSEEESPEYAMISDWAMNEQGTRYKLAEHLREAGLRRLSTKLLMGDMESTSNPPNVQKAAAALPQKPSLNLLMQFPTENGTMNIMEQIGTHYEDLGILLLNDGTGEITAAIISEYQRKASDINREVLKRWIKGQGKQPVTWETLIGVLNSIELSELARKIENGLRFVN